jgi:hypothetical protein
MYLLMYSDEILRTFEKMHINRNISRCRLQIVLRHLTSEKCVRTVRSHVTISEAVCFTTNLYYRDNMRLPFLFHTILEINAVIKFSNIVKIIQLNLQFFSRNCHCPAIVCYTMRNVDEVFQCCLVQLPVSICRPTCQ